MAQGYERKDNRPKMCFKGGWTKDHHVEDFAHDFCPSVFFCYFQCSLFRWNSFSSFFFFLAFAFIFDCLCFSCICTLPYPVRWVQYFSSEHRNLIVYDLERTLLVFAFSMESDPWSGLIERNYQAQKGTTSE